MNARTMAMRVYHCLDKEIMATTLPKVVCGTLTKIAHYFTRSWRVSPLALSLSERIRWLYLVIKEHWLVSLSKHTGDSML
ncbi:hypothetical protein NIE88_20830 [Sporolactobacillus shoreicorticis]|uniref:Uncharacterized protein n=1 Tax=Sporolactobacillus shoreicorticis TaxID=1923877 RepID=A0ABW5S786_9BACL|nr:hypothetical protein [Sporolactobacillus shoreicorticis]MCO7128192.1 hypothetical protein [Sporolactobacillus shoreicorticis]